jgi:hypothetical protein
MLLHDRVLMRGCGTRRGLARSHCGRQPEDTTMRISVIFTAAALLAATVSGAYAQGTTTKSDKMSTTRHKASPGMTTGSAMKSPGGNNAEMKGNNGNSAGGDHSSANTNNPEGMGNNAGPPMK